MIFFVYMSTNGFLSCNIQLREFSKPFSGFLFYQVTICMRKKNVKTLIKIEILLNFTDIFTELIFSKVVLDDYSLRNFKQTIYKSTKYNIIQLQI